MLRPDVFNDFDLYRRDHGIDKALQDLFSASYEQAVYGEPEIDVALHGLYEDSGSVEAYLKAVDEKYRSLFLGYETRFLDEVVRPVRRKVDDYFKSIQDQLFGGGELTPEEVIALRRQGFPAHIPSDIDLFRNYPNGCCRFIRDEVESVLVRMTQNEPLLPEIMEKEVFQRFCKYLSEQGRFDRIYGVVKGDDTDFSFHSALRVGGREHVIWDVAGDAFADGRPQVADYAPGEYVNGFKNFERYAEFLKVKRPDLEIHAFNPALFLTAERDPVSFHYPILWRHSNGLLKIDWMPYTLVAKNTFLEGRLSEDFLRSRAPMPDSMQKVTNQIIPLYLDDLEKNRQETLANPDLPDETRKKLQDPMEVKKMIRVELGLLDEERLAKEFSAFRAQGLNGVFHNEFLVSPHVGALNQMFRDVWERDNI